MTSGIGAVLLLTSVIFLPSVLSNEYPAMAKRQNLGKCVRNGREEDEAGEYEHKNMLNLCICLKCNYFTAGNALDMFVMLLC